jgi:CheY-like chemotaxis protein
MPAYLYSSVPTREAVRSVRQRTEHASVPAPRRSGSSSRQMFSIYAGLHAAAVASRRLPATVLIVDDEPSVRALAVRALNHAGYQTIEAPDGREAWFLLRHGEARVDLVLTDVVMPHLTGNELAALIRGILPHIPIILFSAYDRTDLQARGIDLDRTAELITKPFAIEDLVRRVQAVLSKPRPPIA